MKQILPRLVLKWWWTFLFISSFLFKKFIWFVLSAEWVEFMIDGFEVLLSNFSTLKFRKYSILPRLSKWYAKNGDIYWVEYFSFHCWTFELNVIWVYFKDQTYFYFLLWNSSWLSVEMMWRQKFFLIDDVANRRCERSSLAFIFCRSMIQFLIHVF